MMADYTKWLDAPSNEPVDARRNGFHVNFIAPTILEDRLTSQSYRPEIVTALTDLRQRHLCKPLSHYARERIRQGITPEYGDDGPPCLKLKDVRHILVDLSATANVSAGFAKENSDSVVTCEAVFVNRSGGFTVGRSGAYLRRTPVFVSDDVFAFLPKPDCDAGYIAAFLNSWWGKRALEAGINGSTGQLKLPRGHVESLPIPIVTLEIQRAIGNHVRKAERLRQLAESCRLEITERLNGWYGALPITEQGSFGWLDGKGVSPDRVDAWFNQPKYVQLVKRLQARSCLIRVSRLCRLIKASVKWHEWPADTFQYFEIGGVDEQSGIIRSETVQVCDAPSRAKFAVAPWDVLVSTVRPNLKNIALVPETITRAVCSSGFSVLRADSPETAGFLWACLTHDAATAQLMRWNTGATYPAIERTVPSSILVPNPGEDMIAETGRMVVEAIQWNAESNTLIETAKRNVEALVAGSLDEEQLLQEDAEIAVWLETTKTAEITGSDDK